MTNSAFLANFAYTVIKTEILMRLLEIFSKGKFFRIIFFCLVWLLYGTYYFSVNNQRPPGIEVLEVAFSIPVYALIAHGVYAIISRLLAGKKAVIGILALLAFYLSVGLIINGLANVVNGLVEHPVNDGKPIGVLDGPFLANLALILGRYSLFGVAAYLLVSLLRNAKARQAEAEARLAEVERRLDAEQEKRRFEFLMLAGQVSPHFMAGLLSTWQLELKNPRVVASMERAYQLMVYYMDARKPEKRRVPLTVEVERLADYVELATGSGQPKHIECQWRGKLLGYTIPPTSLIELIENCTKHGRTDLPDHPIRMDINVEDNRLHCVCTNVVKENSDRPSHGVGLANLNRRLELEYNDRYRLDTQRQHDKFITQLTINY